MIVLKILRSHVSLVCLLWFFSVLAPVNFCFAQDPMRPYILSELVQVVASMPSGQEYKVLKDLVQDYPEVKGSDRVVLFLDALTAADMIAKTRAHLLRSERKVLRLLQEDVELSFSWFCFPFGPPHKKKKEVKDARKQVIENMYMNSDKRANFQKSINLKLLRLPKKELMQRKLNIFDILYIENLIKK